MKRISYMPSGASSGSVTVTALPVANSADWIVVLYKYIAVIIIEPPPDDAPGTARLKFAGVTSHSMLPFPLAHIPKKKQPQRESA